MFVRQWRWIICRGFLLWAEFMLWYVKRACDTFATANFFTRKCETVRALSLSSVTREEGSSGSTSQRAVRSTHKAYLRLIKYSVGTWRPSRCEVKVARAEGRSLMIEMQTELFVTAGWCATWQILLYLLTLLYTITLTYTISQCFSNEAEDFVFMTQESQPAVSASFQTLFSQSWESWFFTSVRPRPHRAVSSCQTREVKLIHTFHSRAYPFVETTWHTFGRERQRGETGGADSKTKTDFVDNKKSGASMRCS